MKENDVSLVFTGDIGFDRYMADRWQDDDLLSSEITKFLHSGDHVIANVEGALMNADRKGGRSDGFFHAMDPKVAVFLDRIHADIWNIGNNHIFDAGPEGLENTLRIASGMGCRTVGAGRNMREASEPIFLQEAGGIGILAVSYLPECLPAGENTPGNLSWNEYELIEKTITRIRKTCRWCVVISHGGEEFAGLPTPLIRERYLRFLDMGADLVVAHHPHVPQNYEFPENNKGIFYSLGNFIFDTDYQRAQYHTDEGVLLKLCFGRDKWSFEALGMRLDRKTECVFAADLPEIFTEVPEKDYLLLSSLSARALVAAEKRKMIYLNRKKYENASEETWNAHFDGQAQDIDDYIKGEYMDFLQIRGMIRKDCPENQSGLTRVKNYLEGLL